MNYGDHAINIAEYDFFNRNNINFIEIPESYVEDFLTKYYFLVKKDTILYLQGGGNMGDVWGEQEKIRQSVFKKFPDNKIVIFPQSTNYMSDNSKFLIETVSLAGKVTDLTILLRDKKSYEFVKEKFPETVKVFLVPDMVLTLDEKKDNVPKEVDAMLYIRRDVERLDSPKKQKYLQWLDNQKNINIQLNDTVKDTWTYVFKNNRRKFLEKKIYETSKARLIVTDRLHGMLFAYVTGTPSIVFDNNNHKIKNLYDTWLKGTPYIFMVDDNDFPMMVEKTNKYLQSKDNFYPNTNYFTRSIDDAIK